MADNKMSKKATLTLHLLIHFIFIPKMKDEKTGGNKMNEQIEQEMAGDSNLKGALS